MTVAAESVLAALGSKEPESQGRKKMANKTAKPVKKETKLSDKKLEKKNPLAKLTPLLRF